MDEETRKKLTEVLDKRKQVNATVAATKRQKEEIASQRQRNKLATDARWPAAAHEIKAAVNSINDVISDEMHFEVGAFRPSTESGWYGSLPVNLLEEGAKERSVQFNVTDQGSVSPNFLIPHSGKSPPSFKLADGSAEKYAAVITDFLSQAVTYAEKVAKTK